jgi:hypothetical protein
LAAIRFEGGRTETVMSAEDHAPTPPVETTYNLAVLPALGGCFLYVTKYGEPVGLYYGADEQAAAEHAAAAITSTIGARSGR